LIDYSVFQICRLRVKRYSQNKSSNAWPHRGTPHPPRKEPMRADQYEYSTLIAEYGSMLQHVNVLGDVLCIVTKDQRELKVTFTAAGWVR
jgi:hypothetical protein